jgi:hypothetical protein
MKIHCFLKLLYLQLFSLTVFAQVSEIRRVGTLKSQPMPVELASYQVFECKYGYTFSADSTIAYYLAERWIEAMRSFEKHFKTKVDKGVIIDAPFMSNEILTQLRLNGFQWQFVWPASIIYNREKQLGRVQNINDTLSRNISVMHELGHYFVLYGMWNGKRGIYGSAAPDWFDEIVPILLETDFQTQKRRLDFKKLKNGYDELPVLFERQHPAPTDVNLQKEIKKSNPLNINGTMVIQGTISDTASRNAALRFYSQIRELIDFLNYRCNSAYVFDDIANYLIAGKSIEQWLADRSLKYNLPDNIQALNILWTDWCKKKQID